MRTDSDEYKRDNAIILVYDDGKYIQLAFYQPEESSRKLTAYSYYSNLKSFIKRSRFYVCSFSSKSHFSYPQSDKRFSVKSFKNYWSIFLFQ
nr:cystatin-like fold lipoprotein [Bacillus velezensis]